MVWIVINTAALIIKPLDPYPCIFLNLALSCIAAMQASLILMSQNRQAARVRMQAEHDYRINLKAELEICYLHEKIDHLLMNQWQRLMEIKQILLELIQDCVSTNDRSDSNRPAYPRDRSQPLRSKLRHADRSSPY